MTTEAELLDAIRADLDDDRPRLMLADLYDGIGRPEQAQIIRLQIEIAKKKACKHGHQDWAREWSAKHRCGYCQLKRKESLFLDNNPLLGQHIACLWHRKNPLPGVEFGWGGCVNPSPRGKTISWKWGRGLVESICCPAADWIKYGPAIWRVAALRRVELSDKIPYQPSGRERWTWANYRAPAETDGSSVLPKKLLDLLDAEYSSWLSLAQMNQWYEFGSAESANQALSDACLRYAANAS